MTRGQINMAAVWVLKSVRKLGNFQYCVLVVCLTDQLINANANFKLNEPK